MKKKVVIAMSGGVDSSVAALLLKQQGYDVIGMMLRLWSEGGPTENKCCTPRALDNAQIIADSIGIPFYVRDYKDIFKSTVVSYFIDTYSAGETPNPCVVCNQKIRFGLLQKEALGLGAKYLATGHYAKIEKSSENLYQLKKGCDSSKDQSYVLYRLNQEQLSHTMFPLGHMVKSEVRKIALENDLIVAKQPDSQDLCFLGKGDYKQFLNKHAVGVLQSGNIVNLKGKVLGRHNGVQAYTIGQRKGLGISSANPLYVVRLNIEKNEVIVAGKEDSFKSKMNLKNVVYTSIQVPQKPIEISVKIRYGAQDVSATLEPFENNTATIAINGALANISPGQSAVFYQKDIVIGGGIITID